MATRTQVHFEALPACVHEQRCQAAYELQRRRLQTLCLWMSSSAAQAEQLMHEVFIACCREHAPDGWRAGDGDKMMEALARRFRPIFLRPPVPAPARAPAANPVRSALQGLAPDLRLVYLLHDSEGYSASRLAAWLGVEREDVAQRIHQARMHLRERLAAA